MIPSEEEAKKEIEAQDQAGVVIIAPHPDDEIIGCYEIITNKDLSSAVIYSDKIDGKRREAAVTLREYSNIKLQMFQQSIPPSLLKDTNTFYFPDPVYEIHPLHRQWGLIGESMARGGFDVIFYSTSMTAHYIHEVDEPEKKKELLNKVYKDQSDLWKYDHRYFLFEGRCKWLF